MYVSRNHTSIEIHDFRIMFNSMCLLVLYARVLAAVTLTDGFCLLFTLQCLRSNSTSSSSRCQDVVPLPTPSLVPITTPNFANIPTPSDCIPVSPRPKGDETFSSVSPSLLPFTVPEPRPPLNFTSIPECEEISKCRSPMTSPEVETLLPSNKQTITPVWLSSACATNIKSPLSPSAQFNISHKAMTQSSDSDSFHGAGILVQTPNKSNNVNSNMTASVSPSSETKATQINFNRMTTPWNKESEKCSPNKISLKGSRDKKTVRFKISSFEDKIDTYIEHSPIISTFKSDVAVKRSLKKDGVIANNSGNLDNFVPKSKLHEPHSYFTAFSPSSSQVKNPLTAFELDTGPKVAKVVPVTSTNNSVTETTNLEHAQLTPDGVDWTHATLESTINIEERHAEVLDNHVATILPEPQFRIATQTSGVAESQLLSDHFVASRYTLDYNTNSVASSDSHPDEYKVNMGNKLAQEKTISLNIFFYCLVLHNNKPASCRMFV